MRETTRRLVLFTAVALAGAACGSGGADAPPPGVLRAAAVPYLPSSERSLSADDLADDAQAPALAGRLDGWGLRAAAERTFQGQSHRLQLVVSRTLVFDREQGARAYVGFVRGHAATYLGARPQVRAFESRGRSGYLFVGQPCACHMAQPVVAAVFRAGRRVGWLELNGPSASSRALERLAGEAP